MMFDAPIKLAVTGHLSPTGGGLDAVRLAEDIKAILDRLDPRVRPLLQFVATNSETTDAELAAALGVAETLLSASAINRADRALDQLKHAVDKLAS